MTTPREKQPAEVRKGGFSALQQLVAVPKSIVSAFALFSRIPMPLATWDERNMRYLMAAFPLVGVVVGAGLWGWWQLAEALRFGSTLRAAGLTLIPIALTGGIHLDGFADVVDALSSHAEPARKREIMKDPHLGAFAVIGVCAYLIAQLALASEVTSECIVQLACLPVLSRGVAGLATVGLKPASETGLLATVRGAGQGRVNLILLALTCLAMGAALAWRDLASGLAMLGACLASFLVVARIARREFGGMSGDVAGFLLQVAELLMLAAIVVSERLV